MRPSALFKVMPYGQKSYCPPGKGPLRIPTLVATRPHLILMIEYIINLPELSELGEYWGPHVFC